MTDDSWERQLNLAEISTLRAEINATLDRMNTNENFCSGVTAALLAFGVSQSGFAGRAIVFLIAAMISAFGLVRYYLLRHHAHVVDSYIADLELRLSPAGGWVTWYGTKPLRLGGFSTTRIAFWIALIVAPIIALVFDIRFV